MGTDIFINNIFNEVKNIKLEEGGSAFLLDKDYIYLAGSESEALFNLKYKNVIFIDRNDSNDAKQKFNYAMLDGGALFNSLFSNLQWLDFSFDPKRKDAASAD